MKLRKFSDVLLRVALAYSAALSLFAVLYVHFMGGGFFYGENGILEISQSVVLFCIFLGGFCFFFRNAAAVKIVVPVYVGIVLGVLSKGNGF